MGGISSGLGVFLYKVAQVATSRMLDPCINETQVCILSVTSSCVSEQVITQRGRYSGCVWLKEMTTSKPGQQVKLSYLGAENNSTGRNLLWCVHPRDHEHVLLWWRFA